MSRIVIIGAGLGGLSAACRMAKTGHIVTVLEKNKAAGGKVNFVASRGFCFDTGASLVTMKHIFEDLFKFCGREIKDYLTFERLDPICRHFWSDGTIFDTAGDLQTTEVNVSSIFPDDIGGFQRYMEDSKEKYEIAERTFLAKSLNELPSLLRPSYLPDLFRISTLSTLHAHNTKYFKSAKLQQLFGRYATYNGSSPYMTPATFALIPHVELGLGAWYPRGGIYEIPRAMRRLADEMGVKFKFECDVSEILVADGSAVGVRLKNGEQIDADIVVSNADAVAAYRDLIPAEARRIYTKLKLSEIEPSCSGFVLLLGTDKKFEQFSHHNMFFSDDYKAEFEAIFEDKIPAENPSIYVCATSRTDPAQAPDGCENLFVLVNAPSTSDRFDWDAGMRGRGDEGARGRGGAGTRGYGDGESGFSFKEKYGDLVIDKLETFGLEGLRESIVYRNSITPEDFETRYRANKGSIYGVSSNGILSAFMRVPNMAKDIENLYFVGGTTHPGGGMPLVLLSGKMAAELIG